MSGTGEEPPVESRDAEPPADAIVYELTSIGTKAVPTGLGAVLIKRNQEVIFWGYGGTDGNARGLNVLVVDPATGEPDGEVATFDPFPTRETNSEAAGEFAAFIADVPAGYLVMIAVADDSGLTYHDYDTPPQATNCTPIDNPNAELALQQIEALGSTEFWSYCYRDSWAIAAVKGATEPVAEAHSEDEPAIIRVNLPIAP